MKYLSTKEISDYINTVPTKDKLDRSDFAFRFLMLVFTGIVCYVWKKVNVGMVLLCGSISVVALLCSIECVIKHLIKGPYTLLSDSWVFLSYSINICCATIYIIYTMSGNLKLGLLTVGGIYFLDLLFKWFFAQITIKKVLYKQKLSLGLKMTEISSFAGAGIGWALAQIVLKNIVSNNDWVIFSTMSMTLCILMNFGLIGFIKYHYYIQVTK